MIAALAHDLAPALGREPLQPNDPAQAHLVPVADAVSGGASNMHDLPGGGAGAGAGSIVSHRPSSSAAKQKLVRREVPVVNDDAAMTCTVGCYVSPVNPDGTRANQIPQSKRYAEAIIKPRCVCGSRAVIWRAN